MGQEYYLGLDMGTNSVGWAVTDENYKLIRVHGKDFWGVREFDEALTAVERRTNRVSRRRRQREQVRIGLLKKYFSKEIEKTDGDFLARLDNSKYHKDDKDVEGKYGIFNDSNYTDQDYFEEYPTIFHLRSALVHDRVAYDDKYARLVFLACLNMFKHRGHFLMSGVDADTSNNIEEVYAEAQRRLEEDYAVYFPVDKAEDIRNILADSSVSRSKRMEKIAELFQTPKAEKKTMMFIRLLCGLKVDVKNLFDNIENEEKKEICFNDYSYDENIVSVYDVIGDDNSEIIDLLKQIYDIAALSEILKDSDYLSDARIASYEKHKEDLKNLKAVYRKYLSQERFEAMFRSEEKGSYSAYVNSYNSYGEKKRRKSDDRKREHIYATIKKDLKPYEKETDVKCILDEVANETFLLKQLSAQNGVIPNQVHLKELKKILENAGKKLQFLSEIDESGLTVSEQILKLFSFQIPYYIGPVSEKSKTGWVVRKEAGEVLPWNLEQKIDVEKTGEAFIENLIRECSYIAGEKVLPKASLLYEKYCVLNEINNIKIDGEDITPALKQEMYHVLFETGKKVTRKKIVDFLRSKGAIETNEQLSGVDITINNSLSSFGKMYAIFGERIREDKYRKIAEEIIRLGTIYGDSKERFQSVIRKYVEDGIITEKDLKRICGYKFKDWGRFSKELLMLNGVDRSTGEIMTLIQAMWEYNLNFMELINSKDFSFKEALEEKQKRELGSLAELEAEDLDDFYFSAPVKRMIWQTLLVIREIEKVMHGVPARVFVEMTRTEGEKKRTESRGKQLIELYKNIKDEIRDWKDEIEKADASGKLKSKKMYLYYTQMGRCMYSGESIDINELFNDNLYDIEHIYPRSFVKDDNLSNNLVLVKKQLNQEKSDTYPIDVSIRMNPNVKNLWSYLREKNLITEEKYKRLTGSTPFTEEQKAGFIARQLVETSQGTKGVADLLKQLLPDTQIVYAKAGNVSDFRKKYELFKCRSINDFHHANDAYLNIVVGNVYFTKFTQNPLHFIQKEYGSGDKKYHYNLGKMFERNVERDGKVAWVAEKDGIPGSIATVKAMMKKNTPMITRRSFEQHGAIANATFYSAKKTSVEAYIPLKSSDEKMRNMGRYGGFTSVSISYYFLVEHTVKNNRIRTLEGMPLYLKDKIGNDKEILEAYCKDSLGLIEPSVRLTRIPIQACLKIDGFYYNLSGRTGKQLSLRNLVSMCLDNNWQNYVKKIDKSLEQQCVDDEIDFEKNIKLYDVLTEKHSSGIFAKRKNSVGKDLVAGRGVFEKLNLMEQVYILSQIFCLSALGLTSADFSLLGGAGKKGTLKVSKEITKTTEFKLINTSVTGIYKKEVDLLTV